jgi:IS30 family transposase
MEEYVTKKASIARGRLTSQEIETVERMSAQGRPTIAIAAALSRYPSTVSDYIRRHGLRPPGYKAPSAPPKPVRYAVEVKNIPPAIYRLVSDCAVRRQISMGEAMLRFAEHVLRNGSPSRALDTVQSRALVE